MARLRVFHGYFVANTDAHSGKLATSFSRNYMILVYVLDVFFQDSKSFLHIVGLSRF